MVGAVEVGGLVGLTNAVSENPPHFCSTRQGSNSAGQASLAVHGVHSTAFTFL